MGLYKTEPPEKVDIEKKYLYKSIKKYTNPPHYQPTKDVKQICHYIMYFFLFFGESV